MVTSPDNTSHIINNPVDQLDFSKYGSYKKWDGALKIVEKVSLVAAEIFTILSSFTAALAVLSVAALVASVIVAPFSPVIAPVTVGLIATGTAVGIIALACFGISKGCRYYLTKQLPPIPIANANQIFETSIKDMIKHASAPKEVIRKIHTLKPEYDALKSSYSKTMKEFENTQKEIEQNRQRDEQLAKENRKQQKAQIREMRRDPSLARNPNSTNQNPQAEYKTQMNQIRTEYRENLKTLNTEKEQANNEFQEQVSALEKQVKDCYQTVQREMWKAEYQKAEAANKPRTLAKYIERQQNLAKAQLQKQEDYIKNGPPLHILAGAFERGTLRPLAWYPLPV